MGGTYWSDGVPVCGPPDAGRYRSLWPVSSDTGLYRAVTVEIPIVTARYGRNSDCYRPVRSKSTVTWYITVRIDRYKSITGEIDRYHSVTVEFSIVTDR
ncbi:hypothetical protein BHM03_00058401 [Ensete ventricosum]|nr:hypothetical protein BHM03_00058401 [Ensete ventricosum]